MLNAFLLYGLPDRAQQLRILMAQRGSPLQMNSQGNARSADGPDVQMMDTLHSWHGV